MARRTVIGFGDVLDRGDGGAGARKMHARLCAEEIAAVRKAAIGMALRKVPGRRLRHFARRVLEGKPIAKICADFNIHRATFHRRLKKIEKHLSGPMKPRAKRKSRRRKKRK